MCFQAFVLWPDTCAATAVHSSVPRSSGSTKHVRSDRCSRTQEFCDVRDNISTSSPLLPSWISCLPQTGTAPLHISETALWWLPHHCHLCEPCSEAPAFNAHSQSGYYQRNEQAVPHFDFVLELAVQCQRTVKAICFETQVYAGHHMRLSKRIIGGVQVCTTVRRSLPENNVSSMHDKTCNSNTTGTCLAGAA